MVAPPLIELLNVDFTSVNRSVISVYNGYLVGEK